MIKPRLDISGWTVKFNRMQVTMRELPSVNFFFGGHHSVLNQANDSIAQHALDNGDEIWAPVEELLPQWAEQIRDAVVQCANDGTDLGEDLTMIAEDGREQIYNAILDGECPGPSRTMRWNVWKAEHFAGPTPNLVASGEWLDSLDYELVRR